jgi:hypothetical protein
MHVQFLKLDFSEWKHVLYQILHPVFHYPESALTPKEINMIKKRTRNTEMKAGKKLKEMPREKNLLNV